MSYILNKWLNSTIIMMELINKLFSMKYCERVLFVMVVVYVVTTPLVLLNIINISVWWVFMPVLTFAYIIISVGFAGLMGGS